MKPSLQLNISQQLTLTPQLQQAIRLLQLSTLELQQEIQQAVEANPLLEISANEEKEEQPEEIKQFQEEPSDLQWSQLYTNKRSDFDELDYNYDNLYCSTTNLHDHLQWQLGLTPMTDVDKVIAAAIIDAVNNDGFLTLSTEDIYASLQRDMPSLDIEEIEAVRHRVQLFDPIGCASHNLIETLLIQLNQIREENNDLTLAKRIISEDLDLVGQHNFRQLMKIYRINESTLGRILHLIKSLNPRPGSIIQQPPTEYIIPDVIVRKVKNRWTALLNQNILPTLSINKQYASLIQRANNSKDNQFIKNHLQEARWFLKSIQSRQETLIKVAQCIVDYQQEFFEHGEEVMKPLILNDIANAIDMHESTVSRVTTQKFMHTSQGVFELKYFFSSHVGTSTGGECSSTAIRAIIKKLIDNENGKKPLSDNKIARLIGEQGIQVARRTVAKYRELMNIPPSNERKTIKS